MPDISSQGENALANKIWRSILNPIMREAPEIDERHIRYRAAKSRPETLSVQKIYSFLENHSPAIGAFGNILTILGTAFSIALTIIAVMTYEISTQYPP
jgi:hypothetical protein